MCSSCDLWAPPNQALVRHEVADVTAVLHCFADTASCSARSFLPQRASLATAGCEACGTREPQPFWVGSGRREPTLRLPAARWSGARQEWYDQPR